MPLGPTEPRVLYGLFYGDWNVYDAETALAEEKKSIPPKEMISGHIGAMGYRKNFAKQDGAPASGLETSITLDSSVAPLLH